MSDNIEDSKTNDRIGIIAGSGSLPKILTEVCIKQKKDIFVIYIGGDKSPKYLEKIDHKVLSISSVGKAIKLFKKNNIEKIVLAGGIKRPSFKKLWPDGAGIKLLAQISRSKLKGDDAILSIVINFFEESGFKVIGADEIAQDIVSSLGVMGAIKPSDKDYIDIELGKRIAKAIGSFDIGQSVIVRDGVVLGVEAVEGTDGLLKRCVSGYEKEHSGVLVKAKKPNQDRRVDLPTIGTETVVNAHKAELAGVAIESGAALIVDKEEMLKKADTLGLFVVGV